jgi:GT2 family glycosyltransferase
MISVIYCTRESNPNHTKHIEETSGLHKNIEVIEIVNNGESLTKAYNRGLKQAKNDIVVFCHDDILIETKQWGRKLLKHFDRNKDYGIIGVAGSKYLPESGKWWEIPKFMYGRVKHTNDGKSWLSEYSDDISNKIEEVVNVDGLFFAIDKNRITKEFDESVEGFHFYDVDFCFQNHSDGVKVGVITNIRINHMSIGETNEEWEKNREIFSEKYKEQLPIKLKDDFRNRKLKVLIGCLNFKGLTGSEISTLELAKGLVKNGCDVTVVSQLGKKFETIAKKHGIKTFDINEPPYYKRGDGKTVVMTPRGQEVSRPNTIYRVSNKSFDIIHANHTPITERLLGLYPECNFVNIVRSEVIDLENPIVNDKIKKYIAIRPSIKQYIKDYFDVEDEKIDVIYNLFDKSRFTPKEVSKNTDKKVTLFVGTMDYLRKEAIEDLIENVEELWLVGKDTMGYASEYAETHDNVKYFPPTDNVEEFVNKCDETAGIFLGRTTIEGYLCGKPGWIYTVTKDGYILDKEYTEVPEDMSIFDNNKIIEKYKELYVEAYNEIG